jgi:hypothetical protein
MRANHTLRRLILLGGLLAGLLLCAGDQPAPAAEGAPTPVVAAYWDTN